MNIEEKIKSVRRSLGDTSEDESERLFTDEELEEDIKLHAHSDYKLLWILFTKKAGRLITNENYIKSIKAGNEELERLNAYELQAMALKQAEKYQELYKWENEVNETSCIVY